MTALTLRADEAAALWRDGAVVVRRKWAPPTDRVRGGVMDPARAFERYDGLFEFRQTFDDGSFWRHVERCPLGSPGDRVWVREAHAIETWANPRSGANVFYVADDTAKTFDAVPALGFVPERDLCADRPAVTMPRWASRGDAVIASVEVEAEPWEWVVRVEVVR